MWWFAIARVSVVRVRRSEKVVLTALNLVTLGLAYYIDDQGRQHPVIIAAKH
jgi:hypothetical protein